MNVAIIGAGIAGLAAARTLNQSGHVSTLFERESVPGGRCATVIKEGFIFDTGASSIAPRGREIELVVTQELDHSQLVQVTKPIYTHIGLRVSPGDQTRNTNPRYAYLSGNATLPALLAANYDMRLGQAVDCIELVDNGCEVQGERFDAVIVATTLPEAIPLLHRAGVHRQLTTTRFRSCLAVLLGYDKETDDLPYHALIEPEQRHPLTWLSVESMKCPGRAPAGCSAMVAQLGPQFSREYFDAPDQSIVDSTAEYVERLFGVSFSNPIVTGVVRWRYSQPENITMFDAVNNHKSRVILAGDGLLGGRVEYAYSTGIRAAKLAIEVVVGS